MNDCAPEFEQRLYTKAIQEEFVPSEPLLTVTAVDGDAAAGGGGIVYRLEGQGADDFFSMDPISGQIRVLKPLDRDPPLGAPKWTFVVQVQRLSFSQAGRGWKGKGEQAIDDGGRGLIGYADVQISLEDINDNDPTFEGGPFQGYIEENMEPRGSLNPSSSVLRLTCPGALRRPRCLCDEDDGHRL